MDFLYPQVGFVQSDELSEIGQQGMYSNKNILSLKHPEDMISPAEFEDPRKF